MADFFLDWATANDDGTTTLSSGSGSVDVTVSTPTNSDGDSASAVGESSQFGESALKPSSGVTSPVSSTISFSEPVENVSFEIFDVDAGKCRWDDKVTVIARDAEGNIVPVTFSDITANHTISGNSIEGEGHDSSGVEGSGASDTVTVLVAGPIVSLELVYEDGDDASHSGTIGYSDISFDLAQVPDGIVEGSSGDDLIDAAYTGDPDGDMIDAGDAILPGEAPDDDIVLAGAGDDIVQSGLGDDEVYGGSGHDTLDGGSGNDVLYGDGTDGFGSATITFEYEEAGYHNTLGVYYVDPETGEFTQVEIAFEDTSAEGSGGDLVPGDSTYSYDNIPAGAEIGVFTITNGDGLNNFDALGEGSFDFRDPVTGDPATLDTATPVLVHVATDGTETVLSGDIYHTAGYGSHVGLNADGVEHFQGVSENADGSVTLGFEDLNENGDPYYANDHDYDDPVFSVALEGPGLTLLNAPYDVSTPPEVLDEGDDLLIGDEGDDSLHGGGGNDTLEGGEGNDLAEGGTGDDSITGGQGVDTLSGGDDRDSFFGGDEGEFVDGGSGGDDYDTLELTGAAEAQNPGGSLNIVYDSNPENGTVYFRDGGGDITGTMRFEEIENVIPCFTPGTMIATPKGERPVEELREGDQIISRDNGIQEIRWIGQKTLNARDLTLAPHLKPILVRQGALGHGLPERDMLVSPNHRLLVANDRTALYFDEHEVLAAAKHLVNNRGISVLNTLGTTYVHFMFDQHEVVLSNGAWTESFQPGDYTLQGMGNSQRNEIFELFPELRSKEGLEGYTAARKTLKRHEAALLLH